MRRRLKMMTVAMLSIAMLVMGTGMVSAAGIGTGEKTAEFNTYLVMDTTSMVPDASFTYSITAGDAANADPSRNLPHISAGVTPEKVLVNGTAQTGQVNVTSSSAVDVEASDSPSDINFVTETVGDEKYVSSPVTLDFSGVTFPEAGVYRYVITETEAPKVAGEGISYDYVNGVDDGNGQGTRILDVYVTNGPNGQEIAYIMHKSTEDIGVKSSAFTNRYETADLTIAKEIAGNMATSDYYEIKVNIGNVNPEIAQKGKEYVVSGSGLNNGASPANYDSISIGSDGTAEATFRLKPGQSITIHGISWHTNYQIYEEKAPLDDKGYKAPIVAVEGEDTISSGQDIVMTVEDAETDGLRRPARYQTSDDLFAGDTTITYTNTKEGVIPTGVMMTILPGAAVILIAAAGIFMVTRRMRRKQA